MHTSPSPKLLMVASQISDKSYKYRQRDETSNHVVVVPFTDGLSYHTPTFLRGNFFIIDGINRVWLQDKQGVWKDGCQQTSTDEKGKAFLRVTVASSSP